LPQAYYYVAMSSMMSLAVVMADWSSHNKNSLIGGLRLWPDEFLMNCHSPGLVGVVMLTSILDNSGIGTISIKR